jgi:hypothetical protein
MNVHGVTQATDSVFRFLTAMSFLKRIRVLKKGTPHLAVQVELFIWSSGRFNITFGHIHKFVHKLWKIVRHTLANDHLITEQWSLQNNCRH